MSVLELGLLSPEDEQVAQTLKQKYMDVATLGQGSYGKVYSFTGHGGGYYVGKVVETQRLHTMSSGMPLEQHLLQALGSSYGFVDCRRCGQIQCNARN